MNFEEDVSSESSADAYPQGLVCFINSELISLVSGVPHEKFDQLQTLNLHLRNRNIGKISKISNLHMTPNLRQINLSYNAISKIEGLDRLFSLVELNLAENNIKEVYIA